MKDYFRPKSEPAILIYDAFQKEAEKRKDKTVDEWIIAERQAVFEVACKYAKDNNLHIPTIEEIEKAERYALGSADYGAKWAYKITDCLLKLK